MLTNGIEGLVHISELSEEHIGHPKEILHEGDEVTLRIIKIEPESHRIGLSLRRVESLAFADMDMKVLEQELEDTDIKVVPSPMKKPEVEPKAEEPAAEEQSARRPTAQAAEEVSEESAAEETSEEPAAEEQS